MATVLDVQRGLAARGFDPGKIDGLIGPATLTAVLDALDRIPVVLVDHPPRVSTPVGVVPVDWMPWCQMQRVVWHWTAGTHKANGTDKKHYHILIEGDGKLVRGDQPITANAAPIKGAYAAHTLNLNTGSIGVSLCGMTLATESPFRAGPYPITMAQWGVLTGVLADLCRRYAIPVSPSTVLSHAEVQATLGVRQKNKWDTAVLPFDPGLKGAKAIGDSMRASVKARL